MDAPEDLGEAKAVTDPQRDQQMWVREAPNGVRVQSDADGALARWTAAQPELARAYVGDHAVRRVDLS